MLSDFRLEFYGGGAGAQRSLIEIYKEYACPQTTISGKTPIIAVYNSSS